MSGDIRDDGPLGYVPVGYANIEFTVSKDGVNLMANADGLLSLARLFEEMAGRAKDSHIHLTPSMQLTNSSQPFGVGRREVPLS